MQQRIFALGAAALLVLAAACGDGNKNPASASSPTTTGSGSEAALADGSTLKVTAPGQTSPSGEIDTLRPTLVGTASTGKYASAAFTYRFQVLLNGGVIDEGVSSTPSYTVSKPLTMDTTYTWQARAEYQGAYGPWSGGMSFTTPKFIEGYIRDQEIYDPLTNGKTVGTVHGPVQWIEGVGVKLLTLGSRITYHLPQTLDDGEFSIMVSGIDEGNPGAKTKVMSMQEGDSDITTNDYRFTVEKRGRDYRSQPGQVRGRVIDGEASDKAHIHDFPKAIFDMSDANWYLWRAGWNATRAEVEVRDITNRRTVYDQSVGLIHAYRPNPHTIHLGAPAGRSGLGGATVAGMIVKNVWVSARPRPEFPEFGQ